MKFKFTWLLTLFMAFVLQLSFAQEKTVTGTVTTASDGLPLPGANVVVKGTSQGTQTDFDGNYSINASSGDVLVFSYVGMKTTEVAVGASNSYNVAFELDNALDEVVITAFGVKKEKKSLGYAVSSVKSEEFQQRPQEDVAKLLRGRAAGVDITASNGVSGGSSNIIIRGRTSITGSNQPLFVVDGIPINTDSNQQTSFFDSSTESNRFTDIDPNNIESFQVLKGLSATALYGNRGRNGVILITTKSGSSNNSGNATFEISSSTFFSNPHLPNYQDEFGGGFNQEFGWFFSNWGPQFSDTNPASYGRYFSSVQGGRVFLTHPFLTNQNQDFVKGFEDLRDSEYEYRPYDSVENFFGTGVQQTINLSISGGNEDFSYNASFTNLDDQGFLPGNTFKRQNFNIGGAATLGKLRVNGSMSLAFTDYTTPPITASRGSGVLGDGSSVYADLLYTPRNVNLQAFNFDRLDGGSIYYRENNNIQNPYWTVRNAKTNQDVTNIILSLNSTYSFNDNISLSYRYGLNRYTENNLYAQNKNGIDGNDAAQSGILRTINVVNTVTDHSMIGTFDYPIGDKFNIQGNVGFNSNNIAYDQDGLESTGQIVFGVQRHFNYQNASSVNSFSDRSIQFQRRQNVFGVFGDVTLSYNDYLYLNGQIRNDWTSVLETDNNSIAYPSVSLSFIPTSAFDNLQSNGLNYLKLRAGYGSSAGFPTTYRTRTALNLDARLFLDDDENLISSNSTSNRLGNPNLKPEIVREYELGLDSRFIDNRIGLNVSVFRKETEDLITDQDLPPSTGFTVTTINGGSLRVEGIEIDLNTNILRNTDGFNWDANFNFYADEPVITSLPNNVDQIEIGSRLTSSDAYNAAVEGQPYGVLLGTAIQTNDEGELLVNDSGIYVSSPDDTNVIGDPNPDFISNLTNTFEYKGFNLGFTFGFRKGGDVFSTTAATLQNRGLIDFPVSRFDTYVLPGVNATTGEPNTTQINATDLAFSVFNFGPASFRVYDGTTIRLSDVSFGYTFKKELLKNTPFNSLSFNLTGANLWYYAFNIPEDANFDVNQNSLGVGNNFGIDFFSGPSAARYGFSVRASF